MKLIERFISIGKIALLIALFFPIFSFSQDLIVLRNGEHINCTITKIDSSTIYYDFLKGERKLSSFHAKRDIRSYHIKTEDNLQDDSGKIYPENTVIIDTTKYSKETSRWINLITYAKMYGLHAEGWAIKYYGYNLRNTSKWSIPILFGIEGFQIHSGYFSKLDYLSADMSYILVGISPFYKLNENFFLNLGINLIIGEEKLIAFYGEENSSSFLGFSPSQGIYFVPKSKVGITMGISVYEKILSAEVYRNDIGFKFEMGIKF